MLERVTIRVADLTASARFYGTTLAELGIVPSAASEQTLAWDDFTIVGAAEADPPTRNLHLGFVAPSRECVDAFWRAGTNAGFADDGAPGERPQYTPSYYGAFL